MTAIAISPVDDTRDSYTLENGLNVILAERHFSKQVSLFLVVETGLIDFTCDKQQTAHILEHLLFRSTSQPYETLLQSIKDKAGDINGITADEETYYRLEVHSNYTEFALETIRELIQPANLTQQNFDISVNEVELELEATVKGFKRLLSNKRPLMNQAVAVAYDNTPMGCQTSMSPRPVLIQDTKRAFDTYYNANNMTLIVTGNFSSNKIKPIIKTLYSTLPQGMPNQRQANTPLLSEQQTVASYSRPLTHKAIVGLIIPAVGYADPDYHAFDLLHRYLDDKVLYEVRAKKGIAYDPRVEYDTQQYSGYFTMKTSTSADHVDEVVALFMDVYQNLQKQGLKENALRALKFKTVLEFDSRLKKNRAYSEELMNQRTFIGIHKRHPNLTEHIDSITEDDIRRITSTRFSPTPVIAIWQPPTFAAGMIRYGKIFFALLVIAFPITFLIRKNNIRKRNI